MTIALVAHDTKKELMVQFCIAYRQILSEHRLIATGTTGRLVAEATGLNVQRFLPGGHGGDQQIVARIACDEVDMLLFFRDPISAKPSEPNEMNLLRICDVHNIPVATNIATAEVLIHGLEHGDLDWRTILNPQHSGQMLIQGVHRRLKRQVKNPHAGPSAIRRRGLFFTAKQHRPRYGITRGRCCYFYLIKKMRTTSVTAFSQKMLSF